MPDHDPYDLWIRRWIPVRWLASAPMPDPPSRVNLHEVFVWAHHIAAIAIPIPPALSGLYRVLYAMTARITGLDRAGEWSERRAALHEGGAFDADAVEAYRARHPDRFRLFDAHRPFLQDPRLSEQCTERAGVNKLSATRPAGNNHSWFSHASDQQSVALESADGVWHLLVWHYYGAPGQCTPRRVLDTRKGSNYAGPLRGCMSYHPVGSTLFGTLLAGLPEPASTVDPDRDLCPWEWPALPDPLEAPDVVHGPCSRLTARSQHALLLLPDNTGERVEDAYVTWAYDGKIFSGDDYMIWDTSAKGDVYPRKADARRALWRDLDALILDEAPGATHPRRPRVFRTAADLDDDLRVQALGFENDKSKDIQFVSAATPVISHLLRDDDVERAREVGQLRSVGELAGARLKRATLRAWEMLYGSPSGRHKECPLSREATARYWPEAEDLFWERLSTLNTKGARLDFRRCAERIYDDVTERLTRHQAGAAAVVRARAELFGHRPRRTTASEPADITEDR